MIRTCLLQSQCNTASAPEATDALSELHASIPVKYPLDQQKAAAIPEPNITSSGTLTPWWALSRQGSHYRMLALLLVHPQVPL